MALSNSGLRSHEISASRNCNWACNQLRAWWVWKIHLQGGSLTLLASWCWLLVEGFSFSLLGLSTGCLIVLTTQWLVTPSESNLRDWGRSYNVFYYLVLEITHHFYILWVTRFGPEKGPLKCLNTKRQGSLEAILETGYHKLNNLLDYFEAQWWLGFLKSLYFRRNFKVLFITWIYPNFPMLLNR